MVTSSVARAILHAATKIIAQQGAGELRVAEVASAASANKRMIYHYFGDRAGLIGAVIDSQFDLLLASDALPPDAKRLVAVLRRSSRVGAPAIQTEVESPGSGSDPGAAAAIVLRFCLSRRGKDASGLTDRGAELSRAEWEKGLVALLDLALPELAPGAAARTAPKPVFRVRSASRPADPRAPADP